MFAFCKRRTLRPSSRLSAASFAALFLSFILVATTLTACGIPAEPLPESKPLQSAVQTPLPAGTLAATNTPITPIAVQAATIAPSPTLPPKPTATLPAAGAASATPRAPAPSIATPGIAPALPVTGTPTPTVGTPITSSVSNPSGLGTFLTSTSVVATLTALAATPTYPPTSTPRPRRRPATVIGAAGDAVPPTTAPDKTGITVQSQSQHVFPNGPATLTIKTKPSVACELSNIRKDAQGKDVLEPISSGSAKTSGSDGVIAWIWSVDGDEPLGNMALVIDCRTVGVKQVTMDVTK